MSQYKIGTVTVANGSATVTGAGTSWLANVNAGDYLVVQDPNLTPAQVVAYEIGGVTNDTTLTLTAPYGGDSGAGLSYVAHRDFHPNTAPKFANGDVETAGIQNRWNSLTQSIFFLGTAAFKNVEAFPLVIDSVQDISSLSGLVDGQALFLKEWNAGTGIGGGLVKVSLSRNKADHDGGTVFSLTVPGPETTSVEDYLNGVGETDPGGTGCLVRLNVRNYVEEFGAVGNATSNADGTNDYSSFIACFNATGVCLLRPNAKYNYTDNGSTHRLTRSLTIKGVHVAPFNAPTSDNVIYVNTPRPPFYMSGVPSVLLKNFTMICNKNGPWTDPYSDDPTTMSGVDFRAYNVHFRGNIDSTAPGDANIGTDNLLTSGEVAQSAKTITDFSPYKTFNNVAGLHGVGLVLSKSLDNVVEGCNISGFGVGIANLYNDLINVDKSRITSNGINFYDKNDPVSAFGRLGKIKNSELLYNSRAPSILFDKTAYFEIDHLYYEVSVYRNSAVMIAAKDSNFKLTDAQFDGLTNHSVPLMLNDNYVEGCIVEDCYFDQYTASPKSAPPLRFINTAPGFLHKRDGFRLGRQKTTVFPSADFSDATNAENIVNFRDKELRQDILTPTNVFDGPGVEHGATIVDGKLSFSDGISTGKFFTGRIPLNKFTGTLTFNILGRSASGGSIFLNIKAVDNAGRLVQQIRNANTFGFTDLTWVVNSTFIYDLDANDMSGATDIEITFPTDGGEIAAVWLS